MARIPFTLKVRVVKERINNANPISNMSFDVILLVRIFINTTRSDNDTETMNRTKFLFLI
jgi:hypothetical protein